MNEKTNRESNSSKEKTWSEEIEIAGSNLVEQIKELLNEGSVRRLIIRRPNGEALLEVPLAAGAAVGGVVTVFAPLLAAIGAMAALIAQFKVEIVRQADESDDEDVQQIEIEKDSANS